MPQFGYIQKTLYNMLIYRGYINNLGKTYREYSMCPKQISDNNIMSFVMKVKEIHPETELIRGKRGGLETARLTLNKDIG